MNQTTQFRNDQQRKHHACNMMSEKRLFIDASIFCNLLKFTVGSGLAGE